MSRGMREVRLTREPVELYKILKFEGLVDSGGAAKAAIEQGLVSVNGVVETRKRKQIVGGDVIGFGEWELQVILVEDRAAPASAVAPD